ncbi:MAG TPA: hypothetical protein VH374_07355 [Polyangia bacterium]|jgi:hypothetical protein|nr:hypothetical protein [Polyangia bacterium]
MRNRPAVTLGLLLFALLMVFGLARRSAEARGDATDALYRCHLDEDTACTIVRQTAQGVVILTYRPPGIASSTSSWSVVINEPTGASQIVRPGTVTIVPPEGAAKSTGDALTSPTAPPPFSTSSKAASAAIPNGAPIID